MATRNRTSARRTKEETRTCQERAYTLKAYGGMSFEAIAATPDPTGKSDTLYANASAARAAYLSHSQRVRGTEDEAPLSVTERRALQDDRYERLIQAWMPRAIGGNGEATDRVLRALGQQSALHGLNVKPATPVPDDEKGGDPADELAERRAAAQQAAAAALRGATPAAPPPPAP